MDGQLIPTALNTTHSNSFQMVMIIFELSLKFYFKTITAPVDVDVDVEYLIIFCFVCALPLETMAVEGSPELPNIA